MLIRVFVITLVSIHCVRQKKWLSSPAAVSSSCSLQSSAVVEEAIHNKPWPLPTLVTTTNDKSFTTTHQPLSESSDTRYSRNERRGGAHSIIEIAKRTCKTFHTVLLVGSIVAYHYLYDCSVSFHWRPFNPQHCFRIAITSCSFLRRLFVIFWILKSDILIINYTTVQVPAFVLYRGWPFLLVLGR